MRCGDKIKLTKLIKIYLLFSICLGSTLLVSCQSHPKDAASAFQPCQELLDKEDLLTVGGCYNRQLIANPQLADEIEETFSEALFKKCLELKEKENYEKAIVCFEGASVLKPDSANIQFLLARSYYEYNETKRRSDVEFLDRAENAITNCLRINPDDDEAYYVHGRILVKKGKLREAIEKYQQALKLNPKKDFLWLGLAMTQEEFGDTSSALANYYQVLVLNPKNTLALYYSAKLYEKTGNVDQAIVNFEKLLEIKKPYDDAEERLEKLKSRKNQPKPTKSKSGTRIGASDGTSRKP